MNAQTQVGVIPASKTVMRTIEVAVLRYTLETVPQTESDAQTQMRAARLPANCIIEVLGEDHLDNPLFGVSLLSLPCSEYTSSVNRLLA
jgi:hypothetical protein